MPKKKIIEINRFPQSTSSFAGEKNVLFEQKEANSESELIYNTLMNIQNCSRHRDWLKSFSAEFSETGRGG